MGCSPSRIHLDSGTAPQAATADAGVLKGQALLLQGKHEAALKQLSSVLSKWPSNARAYLERGNVHLAKQQWELAAEDFSAAIKFQANYVQAYFQRAQARLSLQRFDDALEDCAAASALDSDNAQLKALKKEIGRARAAAGALLGEEEDPFAGLDTPKESLRGTRKLCMVCMDNERGARLHPCMHAALCAECADSLQGRNYGCPICGQNIDSIERGAFIRTFAVEEAQAIASIATNFSGTHLSSPSKSPAQPRASRFGQTTPQGTALPAVTEEGEGLEASLGAGVGPGHEDGDGEGQTSRRGSGPYRPVSLQVPGSTDGQPEAAGAASPGAVVTLQAAPVGRSHSLGASSSAATASVSSLPSGSIAVGERSEALTVTPSLAGSGSLVGGERSAFTAAPSMTGSGPMTLGEASVARGSTVPQAGGPSGSRRGRSSATGATPPVAHM